MFEEIIERKRQSITKLEGNIERNRDREVWNDEFGARLEEWIEQDEAKISEIEEDIRAVELKLESVRSQLADL
jgi:chromosome segregation ATPase